MDVSVPAPKMTENQFSKWLIGILMAICSFLVVQFYLDIKKMNSDISDVKVSQAKTETQMEYIVESIKEIKNK